MSGRGVVTLHQARAVRAGDGWVRWSVACNCGWRAPAVDKLDAERRADTHNNVRRALSLVEAWVTEECYDREAMEYNADYPCTRCELRQLLAGVA